MNRLCPSTCTFRDSFPNSMSHFLSSLFTVGLYYKEKTHYQVARQRLVHITKLPLHLPLFHILNNFNTTAKQNLFEQFIIREDNHINNLKEPSILFTHIIMVHHHCPYQLIDYQIELSLALYQTNINKINPILMLHFNEGNKLQ